MTDRREDSVRASFVTLSFCVLLACGGRTTPLLAAEPPTANPQSALSSLLLIHVGAAGCATIVSTPQGGGPPIQSACIPVVPGDARLASLGLGPSTTYTQRVTLNAGGEIATVTAGTFVTGALPALLQPVHLQTSGPAFDGYLLMQVLTGTELWAAAFDSTGAIRWYADLGESGFGELKQQPNGDFTSFVGASNGSTDVPSGHYVELRPSGELVASYVAPPPLLTDGHELRLGIDASGQTVAHFFGYQIGEEALPPDGAQGLVAMHSLVRLDGGRLDFELATNSFRSIADWIEPPFNLPAADFDHPNALQIDSNGNYLVSYRALGEVDSIDATTGKVLWTLGGTHSTLTIVGDPEGFFSAQHCARLLPNGNVLLYDNGWRHSPQETRAAEYAIDLAHHTATLVWQHHHSPAVFTPYMGSVQRLLNGDTVVAFSYAGAIDEVAPDGTLVWQGTLMLNASTSGVFYRAIRIAALDEYREP